MGDYLTCGTCKKEFLLQDILTFIEHKTRIVCGNVESGTKNSSSTTASTSPITTFATGIFPKISKKVDVNSNVSESSSTTAQIEKSVSTKATSASVTVPFRLYSKTFTTSNLNPQNEFLKNLTEAKSVSKTLNLPQTQTNVSTTSQTTFLNFQESLLSKQYHIKNFSDQKKAKTQNLSTSVEELKQKQQELNEKKQEENAEPSELACSLCGECFSSSWLLLNHAQRQHHLDLVIFKQNGHSNLSQTTLTNSPVAGNGNLPDKNSFKQIKSLIEAGNFDDQQELCQQDISSRKGKANTFYENKILLPTFHSGVESSSTEEDEEEEDEDKETDDNEEILNVVCKEEPDLEEKENIIENKSSQREINSASAANETSLMDNERQEDIILRSENKLHSHSTSSTLESDEDTFKIENNDFKSAFVRIQQKNEQSESLRESLKQKNLQMDKVGLYAGILQSNNILASYPSTLSQDVCSRRLMMLAGHKESPLTSNLFFNPFKTSSSNNTQKYLEQLSKLHSIYPEQAYTYPTPSLFPSVSREQCFVCRKVFYHPHFLAKHYLEAHAVEVTSLTNRHIENSFKRAQGFFEFSHVPSFFPSFHQNPATRIMEDDEEDKEISSTSSNVIKSTSGETEQKQETSQTIENENKNLSFVETLFPEVKEKNDEDQRSENNETNLEENIYNNLFQTSLTKVGSFTSPNHQPLFSVPLPSQSNKKAKLEGEASMSEKRKLDFEGSFLKPSFTSSMSLTSLKPSLTLSSNLSFSSSLSTISSFSVSQLLPPSISMLASSSLRRRNDTCEFCGKVCVLNIIDFFKIN